MVFKGCQRCSGDLWAEEDIVSRLQDLVCLQCGHRQAAEVVLSGPNIEEGPNASRWLMSQRRSRVAAETPMAYK
jgi:DNA-directed RNA polymerase subunit RPC12/RpoP